MRRTVVILDGVARKARALREAQPAAVAVLPLGVLLAAATFFNSFEWYGSLFRILAVVAAALAALDRRVAAVLIVGAPAIDAYGSLINMGIPLAALVGELVRGLIGRRSLVIRPSLLDLGVAGFFVAAVLSLTATQDWAASLTGILRLAVFLGIYWLVVRFQDDPATRRLTVHTIVGVGVYSAVLALGQVVSPGFIVLPLVLHETGISFPPIRATAFYENPNTLAVLLVLSLTIALESLLRTRVAWRFVAWSVAVTLIGGALVVSQSRGGMVGAVAAGGVLALAYYRPTKRAIASMMLAATGILAVAWWGGAVARLRTLIGFQNDSSAMDRIHLSAVSISMFTKNLLTGVGIDAFPAAYPSYRHPDVTVEVTDAHQMPFSIPAEMGMLGLVAETVVAAALIKALVSVRSWVLAGQVMIIGIPSSVAFLTMSFFNRLTYFHYFWISLALASALISSRRSEPRHSESAD